MKLVVRCTFEVEVDVLDSYRDDLDLLQFMIHDNSCPGTGSVGRAIEEAIELGHETGKCWACPTGQNTIVSIDGIKCNGS